MNSISTFMWQFFEARVADAEREMRDRMPFRNKFFTADCVFDSRTRTLEILKSEEIESVDSAASTVITFSKNSFKASVSERQRKRYHLVTVDNNWLIRMVEIECPACSSSSIEGCRLCKGTRWIGSGFTPPPQPPTHRQ